MKRWKKALSAFVVAAVMGISMAAVGCGGDKTPKPEGGSGHDSTHTWNTYDGYAYKNDGANGHYRECKDCDEKEIVDHHTYDNEQDATCDDCGYVREIGGGVVSGTNASFFVESDAGEEVAAGGQVADNDLFTINTAAKMGYAALTSNPPSATTSKGDTTFAYGIRTQDSASAAPGAISIVAKKNVSLKVYAMLADNTFNSNRPGTIYYTTGDGLIGVLAVTERKGDCTLSIDVAAGETLTITSNITHASGGKLWLFGVDASELSAAPNRAVTSLSVSMARESYELSEAGSVTIAKDDVKILANGKYLLDDTKWNVSYAFTGDSVKGNGPWTFTEAKTYQLTVSASKSGASTVSADPINVVIEAYAAAAKVEASFAGGQSSAPNTFTATGSEKTSDKLVGYGIFQTGHETVVVNNVDYASGLKVNSSGSLEVVVKVKSTLTLYLGADSTMKVDGVATSAPVAKTDEGYYCYVLVVTLEAGTHTITNGAKGATSKDSENSIFYAILEPVAE